MSFSFSIPSKPKSKSNTLKRSSATFADNDRPQATTKTYVSEFNPSEPPRSLEPKTEPIAPLPNRIQPSKKLKNLTSLALESNPSESTLQFEIDPESQNPKTDDSMGYGLNLRGRGEKEKLADFELRKLKEDLRNLPDAPEETNDFEDVPLENFAVAILSGYGWKEGRGIGKSAKEDVKVREGTKKVGRGGIGFSGEVTLETNKIDVGGENFGKREGADKNKMSKGKVKFGVGKEVRVVRGKEIGAKGKIVEEKSDGEVLVLRISKSDQRLKVRISDVAEIGSEEEDRCLRKLKELRDREKNRGGDRDRKENDRKEVKKRAREDDKPARNRVNWLRNHIRVRIVSEELKGGRLYLKKGVVVDVVGPGICDVSMDENSELVQGVDQDWLETALPRRGGPVLVLFGSHKGVYGNLVERDSETEIGVVRDADTHELLKVKLEQIAEYTGDPSDFDY